jgi:hypothetical protein
MSTKKQVVDGVEMEVITVPIDWKAETTGEGTLIHKGRRVRYFEMPVSLPKDTAVYLLVYSLTLSKNIRNVEVVRRPSSNDPPDSMAAACIADLNLDRAPRGERIEKTFSPLESSSFLSCHTEEYGNAAMVIPLAIRVFTDFTLEKGQVIKGEVRLGIGHHKDYHKPVPLPPTPPKTLDLAFERIEKLEGIVAELQAAQGGSHE